MIGRINQQFIVTFRILVWLDQKMKTLQITQSWLSYPILLYEQSLLAFLYVSLFVQQSQKWVYKAQTLELTNISKKKKLLLEMSQFTKKSLSIIMLIWKVKKYNIGLMSCYFDNEINKQMYSQLRTVFISNVRSKAAWCSTLLNIWFWLI
jgi:hypothetical protein